MGKKQKFQKKSITIISTALLFGAMVPQAFAASTFNDISNSYAKDAILQLAEKGIINGVSTGLFDPKGVILRQDFAVILAKALNLDVSKPPSIPTFSDVPADHYAYKYVEAAAHAGLINGRGGGLFGKGTTLSRQDMAVIFVRSLGVDTTGYAAKLTFSDKDAISEYAKDAVGYAVAARLIQGTGGNAFNPLGVANRQDVASVAYKFLVHQTELAKPEPSPEPTPNPTPTPSPVPTLNPVPNPGPSPNPVPLPVNNHAPVASLIDAKSINIDQHVNVLNVASVFTDRDGDMLTYSASSSNPNVATVSFDGNDVYVSGIRVGSCTITLTADDRRGGVAATTFVLNVTQSPQQAAIDKIDGISKNGDASEITLNDINNALLGKSVSILEGNLEVYRDAISRAEDLEFNSADKIAEMVTDVNATLDKEVTTGITVGGAILKYHLLIDPMEFNVASASKVISFATPMDDPFTNSNIYSIMKKTAGYGSKYFFNIPTSTPLNLKIGKAGDYQVLFIYVDQDKKSVGYSVHNHITVKDINHIPVINHTWAAPSFLVGTDKPLDLTGLFTDEDENDTLTYSIEALDPEVADVTPGEATEQPTIHPVAAGNAQFKVMVSDGHGGTNETTISVAIHQPNGTGGENATLDIKDLTLYGYLTDSILLQYTSVQGATSEVIQQSLNGMDWVEASTSGILPIDNVTFIDVQDLIQGQHYYFRMKVSNDMTTSYSNIYEYTVPSFLE
ncbi:S-layer homology domain-containing protein [Paenibacillus chibensis]|uniref:S-layer homology domain-containing protein n=1 Tax=Paenibacillus chibensis TaxID=59846 RepID=UPI000FDA7F3A|nr:S-layer homology domain-containing protein [Paenibacillus chibensis]MEC0371569.1 S-layer homology domain-containing protein [Paenibacillus chibensis]